MTTNSERDSRAELTLAFYQAMVGEPAPAECVTDLVADIGHFCVENDLAHLYLLARGVSHWRLEMTDPDGMVSPEVTININESKSS